MEFKGSRTEKNLLAAFQGESMARNKYLFFAEKARQEHHPEISELFEKLALNEGMHGKLLYQKLTGVKSTLENLQTAAQGEYGEWSSMYPEFAKIAAEEGFEDIAKLFEAIAQIEKDHEQRFMQALVQLTTAKATQIETPTPAPQQTRTVTATGYRCVFCGAIYDERHDVCPVCEAIGSFEETTYQKAL